MLGLLCVLCLGQLRNPNKWYCSTYRYIPSTVYDLGLVEARDREITTRYTTETGYQIPRLFWCSNNLLFAILHIQLPSDGWIWLLVTEGPPYTKPHTGVQIHS
jgi:hypothetical protein